MRYENNGYHQSPSKPTNPARIPSTHQQHRKSANLTCKQEDGEVPFLFDGTTPVPGARQPSVDATASIVKIIRSRAIKPVPEEVRENFFDKTIDGAELLFDEPMNGWLILKAGDL